MNSEFELHRPTAKSITADMLGGRVDSGGDTGVLPIHILQIERIASRIDTPPCSVSGDV